MAWQRGKVQQRLDNCRTEVLKLNDAWEYQVEAPSPEPEIDSNKVVPANIEEV